MPTFKQLNGKLFDGIELVPVFQVRLEPEDFKANLGIQFQEDFDDLDRFIWAAIETSSGHQFALTRYVRNPGSGTTAWMPRGTFSPQIHVPSFLVATGLLDSDITWVRVD
jgi:hypothetical protein